MVLLILKSAALMFAPPVRNYYIISLPYSASMAAIIFSTRDLICETELFGMQKGTDSSSIGSGFT